MAEVMATNITQLYSQADLNSDFNSQVSESELSLQQDSVSATPEHNNLTLYELHKHTL